MNGPVGPVPPTTSAFILLLYSPVFYCSLFLSYLPQQEAMILFATTSVSPAAPNETDNVDREKPSVVRSAVQHQHQTHNLCWDFDRSEESYSRTLLNANGGRL